MTYNWQFPHELWLAVVINGEGGIASAIHQRDGILAGAFPDANGASHEPRNIDPTIADSPNEESSWADRSSHIGGGRRFWLRFASALRGTDDR